MDKAISDWFEIFWRTYPSDLSHGKKGSKGMALKAMLKTKPDEEERTRILANLKAQIRAAKQDPKPDRWKHATTYINNRLWEDEIESMVELKERTQPKKCQWNDCKMCVHGSNYQYCTDHLYESTDPWKPYRKQAIQQLGLMPEQGESVKQWGVRCKEFLKKNYGSPLARIAKNLSDI